MCLGKEMDVSIIIVNYNTKDLLQNCINSIYKNVIDINYEIIVSDNGSTDGSTEMIRESFPNVVLIENKKNLGFGAANNKGLKIAKGKYIFYLNSDTLLLNNAPKLFFDYWENSKEKEKIGALGTNLLNENNQIIHSCANFPNLHSSILDLIKINIVNLGLSILYLFHVSGDIFRPKHLQNETIGNVDYITGADLFLLNNNDAKFDESFFLYYEETDLQKRMEKKGLKRIMIKGPIIKHLCGGSVGEGFNIKRKASFSRIQFEVSRITYLKKHYNSKLFIFVIKLLISINWINPFIINNTRKYLQEIWSL